MTTALEVKPRSFHEKLLSGVLKPKKAQLSGFENNWIATRAG